MDKEPTWDELVEEIRPRVTIVKRNVQTKTRCKRCPVGVKREGGEYMHVDEQWRTEKIHGHYAEPRYERHASVSP